MHFDSNSTADYLSSIAHVFTTSPISNSQLHVQGLITMRNNDLIAVIVRETCQNTILLWSQLESQERHAFV